MYSRLFGSAVNVKRNLGLYHPSRGSQGFDWATINTALGFKESGGPLFNRVDKKCACSDGAETVTTLILMAVVSINIFIEGGCGWRGLRINDDDDEQQELKQDDKDREGFHDGDAEDAPVDDDVWACKDDCDSALLLVMVMVMVVCIASLLLTFQINAVPAPKP